MKKLFFLSMTFIFITSLSQATIRRLQYWGLPVAGVDYTTGNAAVAASAVGDTILVFLSTSESFTIDKRLVIIGPGSYNWIDLDPNFNPNLQNVHPTTGGVITATFAPGSDGTIITGCQLAIYTSGVTGINNIKIRNCSNRHAGNYWYIGNGTNLTYDNWEFSKCHIYYQIIASGTNAKVTNFKLFNCMGENGNTLNLSTALGQTGIIENCSFSGGGSGLNFTSNGFLIQNCIFHNGVPSNYSNCVFNNNVFYNTPPGITGSNNVFNATANNIYVGIPTLGTYSIDGKFALKVGSPAIGVGIGGIDAGAFGGVNPYKLSMIPAIPAFYKLTSPGTAATANPYQITFSVRANN